MDINTFYAFLLDLPVEDFIPLVVGILLLRKYKQTKIIDYFIFAMVFVFSYLGELFTFLSRDSNILIYFQLTFLAVHFTYVWLLVHIHRIQNKPLPNIRFVMEIILGFLLTLIILQWELMVQPEVAPFFGIELSRGSSIYFPRGAGVYLFGGSLLVSTAHANLIYLYWVYVNGLAVYAYISLDLEINTAETRMVRNLWIAAFGIAFIWTLSILSFFYTSEITNLLIIITFFLEIYIAFKYPEAMLLSHIQIKKMANRIEDQYQTVNKDTSTTQSDLLNLQNTAMTEISEVYLDLPYDQAKEVFSGKDDIPRSVYILSRSGLIYTYSVGEELSNYSEGLIANLITALLSFFEEILSSSKSNHYRFQTDNYNLTIMKLGELLICYIFEGFPPLAEIRLQEFIREQMEDTKKASFWKKLEGNVSVLNNEDTSWLEHEIEQYFSPK